MFWKAGAQMLKRLRPANRGEVAGVFDSYNGVLPDNAHGAPLTILKTMSNLLVGPFIDEEARRIYKYARLTDQEPNPESPSLLELARLGDVMREWIVELDQTDDLAIDGKLDPGLAKAPESMKRGVKLIVQTMLKDHLSNIASGARQFFATENLTPAQSLEVATSLIQVESDIVQSPFLQEEISRFLDLVFARQLPEFFAQGAAEGRLEVALWLGRLASVIADRQVSYLDEAYYQTLHSSLKTWNEEWNAAVL